MQERRKKKRDHSIFSTTLNTWSSFRRFIFPFDLQSLQCTMISGLLFFLCGWALAFANSLQVSFLMVFGVLSRACTVSQLAVPLWHFSFPFSDVFVFRKLL